MDLLFERALFIFRRDLRVEDNTGLLFALKHAKEVVPCFIFTPEQVQSNSYLGNHSLQFLIESLEDLQKQLDAKGGKLHLFYGKSDEIIGKCIDTLGVDAVIVNRDYTPYSLRRDSKIETLCKREKVEFHSFEDALLQPPEETLKKDGTPYTVFTHFYRNSSKLAVEKPKQCRSGHFYRGRIAFAETTTIYKELLPKRELPPIGGREKALHILRNLKKFKDYDTIRDFPENEGTTHLSAHLKFTTCSPREAYFAILKSLGDSSGLIRALYWRDFFSSISLYFPYVFKEAFHKKFSHIKWSLDKKAFQKWCDGQTGFPIVDAGMRELNQTGFMHNRVRMVVASFLIKDLHIDWRWGEKYFAQQLIDYDPAVNNGNWQWVAGTGCDAQPYFRVFNPWTQSKTYDPDCVYIKQWIPELAKVSPKVIHSPNRQEEDCPDYPLPMVDHSVEAKRALDAFYL